MDHRRQRRASIGLIFQLILPLLSAALPAAAQTEPGWPLVVRSAALELNPEQPGQRQIGALQYVGGLILAAEDEEFGGYSGLAVDADGRGFWAISDLGHWLRLDLVVNAGGVPERVGAARILPLRDARGQPMERKRDNDAEALRRAADGHWLVAFERWHRIWAYAEPGGPAAMAMPMPAAAVDQPGNGGIEAMAVLPDGGLLLLSEEQTIGAEGRDGAVWLQRNGQWLDRAWPLHDDFKPTDAVALPNGDVIVLERYFTPVNGPRARLRRLAAGALNDARLMPTTLAEWARPVSVDNMEALDARRAADGSIWLYILSDDNRNSLQRTLLMVFRLDAAERP